MKQSYLLAAALTLMASAAMAQTESKDQQIADAVMAAPEALRAGATVVSYDAKGEPMVLRQGTNNITCTPNAPGGTSTDSASPGGWDVPPPLRPEPSALRA